MKKLLAIVAVAGLLFAVQPVQDVQADPPPEVQICKFLTEIGFSPNLGQCVSFANYLQNVGPVRLCQFFKEIFGPDNFTQGQCVSAFRHF